jgi:molecular chaperone DnaK
MSRTGCRGPERRRARQRRREGPTSPPGISATSSEAKRDAEGAHLTGPCHPGSRPTSTTPPEATKDAGQITSASPDHQRGPRHSRGLDKEGSDQTILVFDLGGGTFGVVLESGRGRLRGQVNCGDNPRRDNFDGRSSTDVAEFKRDGSTPRADRWRLRSKGGGEGEDRASSTMTTQINLRSSRDRGPSTDRAHAKRSSEEIT